MESFIVNVLSVHVDSMVGHEVGSKRVGRSV